MLEELAAEGGPPVYTLTPAEAHNTLLRAQSGPVHKPGAIGEYLLEAQSEAVTGSGG